VSAIFLLAGDPAAAAEPPVVQLKLSLSNVYLIKSPRPVLVDAGGKGDMPGLETALASHGVQVRDLAVVLVTHGHSDHAALSAEIRRRSGALLVLGKGDVPMASAGHNDELKPTNLTAEALKRFAIDPRYEAFTPDIEVDGELDLSRFGIAGRAVQMPGHTPGSMVVILDDGRVFVGDMILGGWMGAALFSDRAGEHYFHADRAGNRANIVALLTRPLHTFYLGHGGPVSRESVLRGFGLGDPRPGSAEAVRTSRRASAALSATARSAR